MSGADIMLEIVFVLLLPMFSLVWVGVGIYIIADTRKFLRKAIRTTGKVIRIEKEIPKDVSDVGKPSIYIYYPVISFTDTKSQRHEFRSKAGNSNLETEVGDTVDVYYEKNRPYRARSDYCVASFHMGAVVAFMAAGFVIAISVIGYFTLVR